MNKSPEALTMRLSMEDVPPVSLHEKHGALLQVASMATSGGSGLARFIMEGFNKNVQLLLRDGANFLERILLDIEHHHLGVDVWSGEKITYYPSEILKAFADFAYRDLNLPEEKKIEMAAEEMEGSAKELLPTLSNLADGKGEVLNRKELVTVLEKYRRLKIPYLNESSRVHEEFIQVFSPPRF